MSATVDSRIVEMRFDNKQFESNAKQTLGTLSRLKEALKLPETGKALEGLDKAAKKISLDGISSGIEALEKRFSTLGIVGMRIIENITDGLMNKLHAAVNVVSDSIVSGGIKRAMNIENAHFQLQALLKDEKKVQAVMADAMESVDGTAYAYDEAAKAASQFAASGIQAGDEMLNALKGITGVAAMTNSSFEDVSRIFTTVAGNGRLMGDQLLQLSSRGLNAASTLADYFREVRGQSGMTEAEIRKMVSDSKISFKDFSDAMTWAFGDSAKRANETFTGAMSNMKSALARIGAGFISPLIEQNGELVNLFNALRIKINDVKSTLVFDEQRSAMNGLVEVTKMSHEEMASLFNTIKSNGKVAVSDLDTLSNKGADATTALTKYINGVSNGTIRASYAITSSISEMTNGVAVWTDDIRRLTEEGKIDLSIFTAAMEKEFGYEKNLSKQFTDFFLDNVHGVTDAINRMDVTKPLELLHHWVEITKNLLKGLLSIVTPFGKAFKEVFSSFNMDSVNTFSLSIERLTSKMKLSEKGSNNLRDAAKGLFSVVKLLVDIFFMLLNALLPINKPISKIEGGFLGLIGAFGRGLTFFTSMIRSCNLLNKAFDGLSSGVSISIGFLSKMIKVLRDFLVAISKSEGARKLINALQKSFEKLYKKTSPYAEKFTNKIENLFKKISELTPSDLVNAAEDVSKAFSNLADNLENFSLETAQNALDNLRKSVHNLEDLIMSNEGFSTFVTNFKEYGEELGEAFTLDNLFDRLERVKEAFDKFFDWIKNTIGPAFEGFNLGSAVSTAGSIGFLYAFIKAVKAIDKLSDTTKNIFGLSDVFSALKTTLVSYQKDLKANMLIKVAGAIFILAAAITVLSFADMERAWQAALMLATVGAALVLALGYFSKIREETKKVNDAASILAKAGNNLAKAVKWKAIGSAVKDFGKTILMVGVAIIALGVMYKKDPKALENGAKFVGGIAAALIGILAAGALIGQVAGSGMEKFSGLLKSVVALSIALRITVSALDKLFKMNLPSDWQTKVGILAGLLIGVSLLALVLGIAGRIAGGGSASILSGLKTPFDTSLKGLKTSSSGGAIKAAPILALAAMLYVTVSALDKLFKMNLPEDYEERYGMLIGIFAGMSVLILALGATSKLAGGQIKAAGSLLSMSLLLAVIVGSLMVLTIVPGDKLMKGAVALGSILITLGVALAGAGKIVNENSYKSILSMTLAVGVITASLAILGFLPGSVLLKGAITLGSILLVLATDFLAVSKIVNINSFLSIIAMIGSVMAIAYSLYELAEQPWDSLLAGAGGLSAVLLAMSASFLIISGTKPNPMGMAAFLESVLGVMAIAYSLYELAEQPWENLLAASASLSLVLLSMSGAMGICALVGSAAPAAVIGVGLLIAFIYVIYELVKELGKVSDESKALLSGGGEVLIQIGQIIGNFIGSIINGVLTEMANALPAIGAGLSGFMDNLSGFIEGSKNINEDVLKGVGFLAAAIIAITAAEVISGIGFFLGGAQGLVNMAINLVLFITTLEPFLTAVKGIDPEAMQAVKNLAEMIMILTAAEMLNGIGKFLGIGGSISDFGEELVKFGPKITRFADMVKDVQPEAVEGAAKAAEIMATMAKKLPAQEGLLQKIVGKKSLADFGEELVKFGPKITRFADMVKDVQPEAVEGAAKAAEIMATMADKLPNSDSFLKKLFSGEQQTLSDFGEELVKFGKAMTRFSDSVSKYNAKQVTSVINNFQSLMDIAAELQTVAPSGLVDFANQFSNIGVTSIDNFVKALKDGDKKVSNAITDLCKSINKNLSSEGEKIKKEAIKVGNNLAIGIQTGIIAKRDDVIAAENDLTSLMMRILNTNLTLNAISSIGQNVGIGLNNGIASKKELPLSAASTLSNDVTNTFKNNLSGNIFSLFGFNAIEQLSHGLYSKKNDAVNSAWQVGNEVVKTVQNNLTASKFVEIGKYAMMGLTNGFYSQLNAITNSATNVARAAIDSVNKAWDINSPSKIAFKSGEFFSIGLAKGIIEQIKMISLAATIAADSSIEPIKKETDTISKIINSDLFDIDPVIRPVIDLTDVKKGVDDISSLMNQTYDLSVLRNNVMSTASSFDNTRKNRIEEDSPAEKNISGNNYEFNQYINSPKALSRYDIYRQTNNQFSAFKRGVYST